MNKDNEKSNAKEIKGPAENNAGIPTKESKKGEYHVSINGKRVAEKVKNAVRDGKSVNFRQIQREVGYTKSSARAMKGVYNNGYKEAMADFIVELREERDAIIKAMKKKRGRASYSDLVRGLDVVIKNAQLLSGNATENLRYDLNDEIKDKLGDVLKKI